MSKTGEILTKFPARYTKDQKKAFREWLFSYAQKETLPVTEIANKHYANVVVGSLDAPLLIAAHYDTAARSFLSIKSEIGGNIFRKTRRLFREAWASILQSTKANPSNYNDNTSGISALLRLFAVLKKETNVALAFLDGEEDGSRGAKLLNKKYPLLGKNLVINLDCIGFGETVGVLYYKTEMKPIAKQFAKAMQKDPYDSFVKKIGFTFATDAQIFPKAINIATFKKGKRTYYFPHIHTPKDTQLQEENVLFIAEQIERIIKSYY
jgi:hypothetical protein